ncbi:MAG: hypothetical protein E2576_14510 [Alcaligenaceae bacterium]|nr:hypothetical protein [Alcaligenaceae bacterium SAGV5]MPS50407.1 hypothetical protein [Alcaligenaceae bacterium SAGV3]MPT57932.1 hypothetical protein [Alcaligenaceae bacterium]
MSGEMTPSRAAWFLERFKREEKLLGPNEQRALEFSIAMLGAQASGQAAPSDEEIIALNVGERYFSETPTKYPEAEHGTQYHAGAPGVIEFARDLLQRFGQAPAASAEPVGYLYQIAGALLQEGWKDWREEFSREAPPQWMIDEGKVKDVTPVGKFHSATPRRWKCAGCGDGSGWYTSYTTGYPHAVPCRRCNPDGSPKHTISQLESDPFLAASVMRSNATPVAGQAPATPDDFLPSVKRLIIAARTTGGTAGRDEGLCTALARVEHMLDAIGDPDWQAQANQCVGAQAPAANGDAPFLQEADQHALHRFIETTEDDESYDIGKDAVKRLAQLGVVSNHGFGRYGVTAFGYWAHERFWHQNPPLPLRTNSDRDKEARAGVQRTTGSEPVAASSNQATIADYEEVLADHRRLVRQLDVALNGEDGAAKQASLCDIVGQVVSEGIKANDAPDAARWRAYRSQWFNVGLIDANTPIGNAMRALSMAGDQHTVDVAADMLVAAIAAGSPLREGGEG